MIRVLDLAIEVPLASAIGKGSPKSAQKEGKGIPKTPKGSQRDRYIFPKQIYL